MTDKVIEMTLAPKRCRVIFDTEKTDLPHPNTMVFMAFKDNEELGSMEVYSIGGGSIEIKGRAVEDEPCIYHQSTFEEIAKTCAERNIRLWQYVESVEGPEIWDYLLKIWRTMSAAIDEGLSAEGRAVRRTRRPEEGKIPLQAAPHRRVGKNPGGQACMRLRLCRQRTERGLRHSCHGAHLRSFWCHSRLSCVTIRKRRLDTPTWKYSMRWQQPDSSEIL